MFKISPSLIGSLLECPRCLWLHFNEELKRPRGFFPSLPGGMDETFKNYFDEYRQKGGLPPEIAGKIDARLFDDMEKLEIWRNVNFGRGGFKAEFPEYDILVSGAIDELLVAPDGKYIPLDFKTRGYPTKKDTHEHYRHQLDFYALLFEKNDLPPAKAGYLLFFWPEKYADNRAEFKTELVEMEISPERAYKILKQVRDIIDGLQPSAHQNCEYCNYREFLKE
ncbi:MAG: PD-(D/E)XK nuclease family protein [bacterium]|nr:PD-(D/E)XK nuclease family protein [bacterium]